MESKTISLSKSIPLTGRISATVNELKDWLNSLDVPFDHAMDKLQLREWQTRKGEYVYSYAIARGAAGFLVRSDMASFESDEDVYDVPEFELEGAGFQING